MKRSKWMLWILIVIVLFLTAFLLFTAPQAYGATNISAVTAEHFAWNEIAGWLDFYATNNVNVNSDGLRGYASSSLGPFVFDSASCPGAPCSISFAIVNETIGGGGGDPTCSGSTVTGKLSGYAWNDTIGWISFSCTNENPACVPSDPNYYRVSVDRQTGNFNGWAWNDVIGWISFNNIDYGGSIQHKVNTGWRPATPAIGCIISPTIDTEIQGGATLNSVLWQGTSYQDTCVDFQFAGSNNSLGPWNYQGHDGTNLSYFGASCDAGFKGGPGCPLPNTPICLDPSLTKDYRYLRYKARLQSNPAQTQSPEVNDIILNWSR